MHRKERIDNRWMAQNLGQQFNSWLAPSPHCPGPQARSGPSLTERELSGDAVPAERPGVRGGSPAPHAVSEVASVRSHAHSSAHLIAAGTTLPCGHLSVRVPDVTPSELLAEGVFKKYYETHTCPKPRQTQKSEVPRAPSLRCHLQMSVPLLNFRNSFPSLSVSK